MSANFYRFPHTPHLAWLGSGAPRTDKVFNPTQINTFLKRPIVVEEKVDGANLGISFGENGELQVQNRGSYLTPPFTGQFDKLPLWLTAHATTLRDVFGDRLILFGEWCTTRHALSYTELPDWFLGFDVFNSDAKKFYGTRQRNDLLVKAGIKQIKQVTCGKFTLAGLRTLLNNTKSAYRDGAPEGFYLRSEDENWLATRAKLVRPEFTQAITNHWRHNKLERNQVIYS